MIRKVHIIGSPLNHNADAFESGIDVDVNNYFNYFQSPTGGAYDVSEIKYLHNPSWLELQSHLILHPADYTTLVFSGHGFHSVKYNGTVLDLNSNEKVLLKGIRKLINSPKKLIIVDACRTFVNDQYSNLTGVGDPAAYMQFPSRLSKREARFIFNKAVANSKNGTQILYSC